MLNLHASKEQVVKLDFTKVTNENVQLMKLQFIKSVLLKIVP